MTCQKGAILMPYYVEKQVFSWCAKTLIFDALLRGNADFLMTCQKSANLLDHYVSNQVFSWRHRKQSVYLMHYYVEKQVFSWRAKKLQIWCIITWKGRFSHDAPKTLIFDALIHEKQVFSWPKTKCIFDALLRFVAGFLMTHQTLLYLMYYYGEKQVFSWRPKKVQICCIITRKSRFSLDTPKTLIIDALKRRKAGFSHYST